MGDKEVKVPPMKSDEEKKEELRDEEKKQEPVPQQSDLEKPDSDELSEEDKILKDNLLLLVTRITEQTTTPEQFAVQKNALEALRVEIRSYTSSMTSVPKPLKFLRPEFPKLKNFYNSMPQNHVNKPYLADVLSILSMSIGNFEERESLKYRLEGSKDAASSWGHEYIRNLAGEIAREYAVRKEKSQNTDDLLALVNEIVPFNLEHNAEVEAVDLLLEVDQVPQLRNLVTKEGCSRVCAYVVQCALLQVDPDDQLELFSIVYDLYVKFGYLSDALRVAMRMEDKDKMLEVIRAAQQKGDKALTQQLCYILGSHRVVLDELREEEDLFEIMGNAKLYTFYRQLAQDLEVKDPKSPEDIYKSYLEEGGPRRKPAGEQKQASNGGVDSAKQNLASSFVSAFVNIASGRDTLITPQGSDWLYKNRAHGLMSTAASLGALYLWDTEQGYNEADRYSVSQDSYIKAGALLASGILSSGVTSEMDAALGLLAEHVTSNKEEMRTASIFGLGLAYAGTCREDVLELLVPLIVEEGQNMETVALICLSLGLVFAGSGNADISGSMIEAFLDRSETDLKSPAARLMCLGLGLLFLGRGDQVDATLQAIQAIATTPTHERIQAYLSVLVEVCAFAGTSSLIQCQKLLGILSEHITPDMLEENKEEKKEEAKSAAPLTQEQKEKKEKEAEEAKAKREQAKTKALQQEAAVIGLAVICLSGDDIAQEMCLRLLDHILQYGEVNIRRQIPLALGLLSVSNPRLSVVDTLSKLSHDQDENVSLHATFSLGLAGAGTNNSRIATLLRSLASYYQKEPNHLYVTRLAQGLLHAGKGLVTLSPTHSDGFLLSKPGFCGLLVAVCGAMDMQNILADKRSYLLFSLVCSIRPRMLVCVDESGKQVNVNVRVGQKVDTVAQAGKPKSITGFQTHKTPVLLSAGDRAEMADDEYIPLSSILEGVVVVKKNPLFQKEK